jgi:hypothetical protein
MFRQAIQKENETVRNFVTRLLKLVLSCNFGETNDNSIRDQVIDKCQSTAIRRRFLREKDQRLGKVNALSRAVEMSKSQAKKMEEIPANSQEINRVNQHMTKPKYEKSKHQ